MKWKMSGVVFGLMFALVVLVSQALSETKEACGDLASGEEKLTALDGAAADYLGKAVAIDGVRAVVGAYGSTESTAVAGAAYVYDYAEGSWTESAKLIASDGSSYDYFGYSVDVHGEYAIVGAPHDDDQGSSSGAAYIFKQSDEGWSQEIKISAPDGEASDCFGFSVAISGDSAIVGAFGDDDQGSLAGAAYLFQLDGDSWTYRTKLLASDGAAGDYFGKAVAIDGSRALVGAYYDTNSLGSVGSAYVFSFDGSSWGEESKLEGESIAFGYSLSLSGNTALVGATGDSEAGSLSGAAFVYRYRNGLWVEEAKLIPSNAAAYSRFGWSASVDGDTAVVGSYTKEGNSASLSGSVAVFSRDRNLWIQDEVIPGTVLGAENDYFGHSVAVGQDFVVVGAQGDGLVGEQAGAVYLYPRCNGAAFCTADYNSDGIVDPSDLASIIRQEYPEVHEWIAQCWAPQGECGDLNEDGQVNQQDLNLRQMEEADLASWIQRCWKPNRTPPSQEPCTYTVESDTQTYSSAGGSGSVSVTTEVGCAWTAVSEHSWITVTSGHSERSSGTVTYTVAENPEDQSRTGSLVIAGETVLITQEGGCGYALQPTSDTLPSSGGSGSVSVTALSGCEWSALSYATWIEITSGSSGIGAGTVTYSVAPTTSTEARTGYIAIAGELFIVYQDGGCVYTIDPDSGVFASSGGSDSVAVTTQEGCQWSATSSLSWVEVSSGASGTGNGTVTLTVSSNVGADSISRSGTVEIAGQEYGITQEGGCGFSLEPLNAAFESSGGTGSVAVNTQSGCEWSAVSYASWIQITSGSSSGSGEGTVSYTVSQATSSGTRTGYLSIADQVFTVTQEGICLYILEPDSASFEISGGSASIELSTQEGCEWSVANSLDWVSISAGQSGVGSGTISYTVSAMESESSPPRTGVIEVAGQAFMVSQEVGCSYSLDSSSMEIDAAGGTGSVTVSVGSDCQWSAVSYASWVQITAGSSGSGDGTVTLSIAASTSSASRTGYLSIAGEIYAVTQEGAL